MICFECDILAVPRKGLQARHEDFDYGRAELVGIAKRLFPEDDAIQSLATRK